MFLADNKIVKLKVLLVLFLILPAIVFPQDVLRGEVAVEFESMYGFVMDPGYPLTPEESYRRALEQAALFFSAQIYGWSFRYDIGERARDIAEELSIDLQGSIPWGDPGLKVTDARFYESRMEAWMDYRPGELQQRRINTWRTGQNRSAQAYGYCEIDAADNWLGVRKAALEDAARSALREMLRGSERNRPKEAYGYISLQTFPRFFLSGGRWVCSARFLVDIREIVPFSVY